MKLKKLITYLIVFLLSLLIWIPIWMLVTGSFMGNQETIQTIGPVFSEDSLFVNWHVLPVFPTMRPYVELLLDSPNFFVMFFNSCKQILPSLALQLVVAVPAAWCFARFRFRGKNLLFLLYITLMIMPFQVTMVSSYLVLNRFHMMNTHLALIVPGIFSTFPVFIMEKFFRAIPKAFLDAAKIDGAGEWKVFLHIGLPMGSSGIIAVMILGFLEAWNALEQPLVFLKDKSLWPLSLYLPDIASDSLGVSMAASVVTMLPALLIFLCGQNYLEQGIIASGIKE